MSNAAAKQIGRPTILLVEDEPAVRRSLQLVLQGNGFAVRSYGSGAALLADPDAPAAIGIVADYRLADTDGVTMMRKLKAAGFAGCAILITAFGSPELAVRAEAAGYDRILEKPLAERLLVEAMSDLIG
jgi:FixJ family two-component response regulator